MKAFVITIKELEESVKIANRCIDSFKNINVEKFTAITPENTDLIGFSNYLGLSLDQFTEQWSKKENAIACFLSHYSLWELCINLNENLLILEHDAICVDEINFLSICFDKVISLGKPSFGKFNIPVSNGINKLTSKLFFPGAHGYMIRPEGAKELLKQAKIECKPTDVFLNSKTFPWLQEYYPWPIEAQDTFSTVQKLEGCRAKHNFNEKFIHL